MDIPRTVNRKKKWLKRVAVTVVVVGVLTAITVAVSRLKPAAPTVDRGSVWLDTVKQGPMVRQVRGIGTLVPEELLWIPAATSGRVEKVLMRAGARVSRDTILLVLSDPGLRLSALEAEYQVKAAEARYMDLEVQLRSQRLNQQAEVARIEADYDQARLRADRDEILAKDGLLAEIDLRLARSNATLLDGRRKIENERLAIHADSTAAQLSVQRSEVERLKALSQLRQSEVEAQHVKAGTEGVLQELPVEVGQAVTPGTILAKVAQPHRLMAVLKIPETQAKEIVIGQRVQVDTRNGVIPGRVSRIDPAVKDASVLVDVKLEGELPAGARPDMNVDGIVELELLPDVIQVGRPAFGQPLSTVSLYRLESDGKTAVRLRVELGRAAVNTIEIVRGLKVGDTVILSDMTAWEAYDRVVLR